MTDPANLITFMLKVKTKRISVKDLLLRSLLQQKQGDLLMMGSYLMLLCMKRKNVLGGQGEFSTLVT